MKNNIKTMTPKQIVAELDKYIIGQDEAKKDETLTNKEMLLRQQIIDI